MAEQQDQQPETDSGTDGSNGAGQTQQQDQSGNGPPPGEDVNTEYREYGDGSETK